MSDLLGGEAARWRQQYERSRTEAKELQQRISQLEDEIRKKPSITTPKPKGGSNSGESIGAAQRTESQINEKLAQLREELKRSKENEKKAIQIAEAVAAEVVEERERLQMTIQDLRRKLREQPSSSTEVNVGEMQRLSDGPAHRLSFGDSPELEETLHRIVDHAVSSQLRAAIQSQLSPFTDRLERLISTAPQLSALPTTPAMPQLQHHPVSPPALDVPSAATKPTARKRTVRSTSDTGLDGADKRGGVKQRREDGKSPGSSLVQAVPTATAAVALGEPRLNRDQRRAAQHPQFGDDIIATYMGLREKESDPNKIAQLEKQLKKAAGLLSNELSWEIVVGQRILYWIHNRGDWKITPEQLGTLEGLQVWPQFVAAVVDDGVAVLTDHSLAITRVVAAMDILSIWSAEMRPKSAASTIAVVALDVTVRALQAVKSSPNADEVVRRLLLLVIALVKPLSSEPRTRSLLCSTFGSSLASIALQKVMCTMVANAKCSGAKEQWTLVCVLLGWSSSEGTSLEQLERACANRLIQPANSGGRPDDEAALDAIQALRLLFLCRGFGAFEAFMENQDVMQQANEDRFTILLSYCVKDFDLSLDASDPAGLGKQLSDIFSALFSQKEGKLSVSTKWSTAYVHAAECILSCMRRPAVSPSEVALMKMVQKWWDQNKRSIQTNAQIAKHIMALEVAIAVAV